MAMNHKYIRFRGNDAPAALFSAGLIHAEIAAQVNREPLSAGFVTIQYGERVKISCYGRSESLQIDARPDDYEVIAELLGIKPEELEPQ